MATGRGKDFEKEIRAAFQHPDISIDRFPDPMAGYAGIRNICDFGVYQHPFSYYFELKQRKDNTLNFKYDITKDQWEGLQEKATIPGVVAGYIVWFIDHDVTVFIPAQELKRLQIAGAKSLNIKDIQENKVQNILVPGKKKRIMFTYDGHEFLKLLNEWATNYWAGVIAGGK